MRVPPVMGPLRVPGVGVVTGEHRRAYCWRRGTVIRRNVNIGRGRVRVQGRPTSARHGSRSATWSSLACWPASHPGDDRWGSTRSKSIHTARTRCTPAPTPACSGHPTPGRRGSLSAKACRTHRLSASRSSRSGGCCEPRLGPSSTTVASNVRSVRATRRFARFRELAGCGARGGVDGWTAGDCDQILYRYGAGMNPSYYTSCAPGYYTSEGATPDKTTARSLGRASLLEWADVLAKWRNGAGRPELHSSV